MFRQHRQTLNESSSLNKNSSQDLLATRPFSVQAKSDIIESQGLFSIRPFSAQSESDMGSRQSRYPLYSFSLQAQFDDPQPGSPVSDDEVFEGQIEGVEDQIEGLEQQNEGVVNNQDEGVENQIEGWQEDQIEGLGETSTHDTQDQQGEFKVKPGKGYFLEGGGDKVKLDDKEVETNGKTGTDGETQGLNDEVDLGLEVGRGHDGVGQDFGPNGVDPDLIPEEMRFPMTKVGEVHQPMMSRFYGRRRNGMISKRRKRGMAFGEGVVAPDQVEQPVQPNLKGNRRNGVFFSDKVRQPVMSGIQGRRRNGMISKRRKRGMAFGDGVVVSDKVRRPVQPDLKGNRRNGIFFSDKVRQPVLSGVQGNRRNGVTSKRRKRGMAFSN